MMSTKLKRMRNVVSRLWLRVQRNAKKLFWTSLLKTVATYANKELERICKKGEGKKNYKLIPIRVTQLKW